MGIPVAPSTPVLMIASQLLHQSCQAGPLPDVPAGHAFWASSKQVAVLLAAGQAVLAPPGYTPVPRPEPSSTVNMVPGLGAGTSNSSR